MSLYQLGQIEEPEPTSVKDDAGKNAGEEFFWTTHVQWRW